MYMDTYMYMYVYTHMNMHTHMYMHTYTCMYTYASTEPAASEVSGKCVGKRASQPSLPAPLPPMPTRQPLPRTSTCGVNPTTFANEEGDVALACGACVGPG